MTTISLTFFFILIIISLVKGSPLHEQQCDLYDFFSDTGCWQQEESPRELSTWIVNTSNAVVPIKSEESTNSNMPNKLPIITKPVVSAIGPPLLTACNPTKFIKTKLALYNTSLADDFTQLSTSNSHCSTLSQVYSGGVASYDKPFSMAYAGHQFGEFVPLLGDGRAHIIGEIDTKSKGLMELQTKGSGLTPYSRRGSDGRCPLNAAIREYIMSEALHHLKINTSRVISVVVTDEKIYRPNLGIVPGSVITRMTNSHIRVGTFQLFSNDKQMLTKLIDHSMKRSFPKSYDTFTLMTSVSDKTKFFVEHVINAQIETVVNWMRVGFIHGVYNTDNVLISGETIDYGPCAFMNNYDSMTVYSSIDFFKRYRYGAQPSILIWNLNQFIRTISQFFETKDLKEDDIVEEVMTNAMKLLDEALITMHSNKLGLDNKDVNLINELLEILEHKKFDWTLLFDALTTFAENGEKSSILDQLPDLWIQKWIKQNPDANLMRMYNPIFVPRNELVERIIADYVEVVEENFRRNTTESSERDIQFPFPAMNVFMEAIRNPYSVDKIDKNLCVPDEQDFNEKFRTFCGT